MRRRLGLEQRVAHRQVRVDPDEQDRQPVVLLLPCTTAKSSLAVGATSLAFSEASGSTAKPHTSSRSARRHAQSLLRHLLDQVGIDRAVLRPERYPDPLRAGGLTRSARTGATLAEVMRRAGHSAAMRYTAHL